MKLLLSALVLFVSFSLSAGEDMSTTTSAVKTETGISSKIDRRKDRRKKRINKKRKRACAKWGRRSYAG